MNKKQPSASREVALPPLGPTNVDRMAAIVKTLMQLVPGFGSVAAEIFGSVIPNQRIERIESYLVDLASRLPRNEPDLRSVLAEPEAVDLFEEGVIHAGRALSRERKEYIAGVVGTGLTGDQRAKIQAKRILRLLEMLDDEQIVLLAGHQFEVARTTEFADRHGNVRAEPFVPMSAAQKDKDALLSRKLALHQLTQLGLLEEEVIFESDGQTARLKRGKPEVRGHNITALGTVLLEAVGIVQVADLGSGRRSISFVRGTLPEEEPI